MKKTTVKLLAILLALMMVFSSPIGVSAADARMSDTTAHFFEYLLNNLFDLIFYIFGEINMAPDIPTVEEYNAVEDEYFYDGTDGAAVGDGWKLGYAGTSVIPVQWRRNAEGNADPNGYNLNDTYYFGGYFTATVDKIYDDQRVNLVVMSPGSDKNNNGIEDIFVFAALDGVGFANKDVRAVREASVAALAAYGVENDDILGFNMNVTHAHSTVDPQGMSLDLVWPLLKNAVFLSGERSVNQELIDCICANTAAAVAQAYGKMESGTLYYSESANVGQDGQYKLVNDKRNQGQDIQDFFACFYFESSESSEKTILANIGMHPTKAGRNSSKVCGDVPHYIGKALNDLGYNFVFIQGAQGAVGLSLNYSDEGAQWAAENTLTYDDWVARYGAEFAEASYAGDESEDDYTAIKATGYTIARLLVDSLDGGRELSPSINIKMKEIAVPVDYDILYLGGVSGLMGFNAVQYPDSESGYGLMVECGYLEIGDIALLLMPGEIFPAIVFGTAEGYTGENNWQGSSSWTGENWKYQSLEEYVREATGDDDKVVLAVGLCNDAIGYVIPDTDASHFSADWLAENHYEELLAPSVFAGSAMTEGFMDVIDSAV